MAAPRSRGMVDSSTNRVVGGFEFAAGRRSCDSPLVSARFFLDDVELMPGPETP